MLRLIRALDEADVLHGLAEANALLAAADMPPLFEGNAAETELLARLELHRRAASDDLRHRPAAPRHNLPAQLTSFIGRESETAHIKQFLVGTPGLPRSQARSDARLVTLTGPGGVGKTRLAIEVATGLVDDFADGAWWIPLSSLNESSRVTEAMLGAFDLDRRADASPLSMLTDYLRERRMLLVLDNCEHLVEACADLAAHLMRHCPNLCILATSREALQVPGELALRVPPLMVPTAVHAVDDALDFDAVR